MPDLMKLSRKILVPLSLSALLALTTGCGIGNNGAGANALSGAAVHPTITGKIFGGQQPVAGALIQLYEVGATGYTGMAKPILTSTVRTASDGTGYFSITGDYTCDAGTYVYLTAAGGDSGNTGTTNSAITLAAALGSCAQLQAQAASTYVTVNEVTTVALAYSLAQFSLSSNFGTTLVAQPGSASSAPADNITTSATNVQGVGNAMAMAQLIANNSYGASPGYNTNHTATVEYWQVNLLSNILFSCVNSTNTANGGASAACSTLFANVNIPAGINPTTGVAYVAPADTLQAAIYMALNPTLTSTQITNLLGLTTPNAPYTPYQATASKIYDLSLAVSFNPVYSTTQLLAQPVQVAFDSYGNAWVANHPTSTSNNGNPTNSLSDFVVELDPVGNPIPNTSATPSSVSNYEITSYTVNSVSTNLLGFNSGTTFPFFTLAIDTNNNVWLADKSNSNIVKIAASGQVVNAGSTGPLSTYNGGSTAVGYALTASTLPISLAIDGNNDVFIATTGGTASNTCSTGNASSALPSTADKGLVTFVGGSNTNVSYGKLPITPDTPILVDGGTAKFTSTSTLVPGQPFVWSLGYNPVGTQSASLSSGTTYPYTGVLWQHYGGTGGANSQGCYTPLAFDGVSTTTSGIASTLDSLGYVGTYGSSFVLNSTTAALTQIPGTLGANSANGTQVTIVPAITGASTTAAAAYLMSSNYGMALDGKGGVWISNTSYTDSTSATAGAGSTAANLKYSITRFQPSYSAAFTPADAAANSSYVLYHDIGGMSSASSVQTRLLAVDGGQNVWMQFSTANSTVGAISYTTGAALSPAYASTNTGFAGSACPSTCQFTGTTTTYSRSNSVKQPAIDASGNVWLPMNGTAAYPKLTVIVGTGVPLSNPVSLAIKNGTFGMKP